MKISVHGSERKSWSNQSHKPCVYYLGMESVKNTDATTTDCMQNVLSMKSIIDAQIAENAISLYTTKTFLRKISTTCSTLIAKQSFSSACEMV